MYKFEPKQAIPQILTSDKDSRVALSAIKKLLDIRDGREGNKLDRFVALGEMSEFGKVFEDMVANEDLLQGDFVCVSKINNVVVATKAQGERYEEGEDRDGTWIIIKPYQPPIKCNGYVSKPSAKGQTVRVYYNGINIFAGADSKVDIGVAVNVSAKAGLYTSRFGENADTHNQMIGHRVKTGVLFIPMAEIYKEPS